jgi:hypothetical protein
MAKKTEAKTEEVKNEIIAETVLGELMSTIISGPKNMQMGWAAMTEQQQKNILFEAELLAKSKIRQIVDLIASTEYQSIEVSIDHAKMKSKNVLAQISFPMSHKNREQFIDQIDDRAVLTLVDPEIYFGEEDKPEAEPDQGALNGFD